MKPSSSRRKQSLIFALALSLLLCSAFTKSPMAFAAHDKHQSNSKTDGVSKTSTAPLPAAAIPVPRPEEDWKSKHDILVKKAKDGNVDVVFYGDSITDWMNVDLLHKIIGPRASNFGIAGDCTEHLLWRLQNGELDFGGTPPRAAVLLIGTNNLPSYPGVKNSTNEEVAIGTKACVDEIQKKFPEMKVLILGILPREEQPNAPLRDRLKETNKLYAKLADDKHKIYYADINSKLLEKDGTLSKVIMYDYLHPTKDTGYQPMLEAIKPYLDKVLAAN